MGNILFRINLAFSDAGQDILSSDFGARNKPIDHREYTVIFKTLCPTTRVYFFLHLGLITTIAIDRHSTKFPQNDLFCRC